METVTCKNCNTTIKKKEIDKDNICPNCGKQLKKHHLKAEPGQFELSISESFNAQLIRAVHMLYYELANEMAFKCKRSKVSGLTIKYSIGAVILSYTAIDNYLTNKIIFEKELKNIIDNMSSNLKRDYERLDIINKIEMLYLLSNKDNDSFNKGAEPLQSLEILKQLRNTAIHYEPFPESVVSKEDNSNRRIENLAKRARHKFDFDETQDTFLWACFSVGAAVWSFELIERFISWFAEEFNLPKPNFKPYWDLND